ncbi:hypothetical protein SG34_011380 [Thalassomonas viridans]|uniref:Uncharacterized protein n=1 Tax=Thalassomonas viridans TaxID=137584 RepID=A0AAE9Z632_9GAMM|nr:hypothetical protein [Thalassomonas viridans]WDE07431.1 hypothetical protein SG34_011380 [Thalassomonas viridans]
MIDILGIAIAFITTMLLFSVLVTALVQAVQQLRSKKHKGLVSGMSKFADAIAELEPGFNTGKFQQLVTSGIVVEKAQYVDFTKVQHVYRQLSATKGIEDVHLQQMFEQAEDEMRLVFKQHMDIASIVISAVIVVVMQLDAFALLNRLSVDREFRQALAAQGQAVLVAPKLGQAAPFSDIERKVNRQFVEELPPEYPLLQELAGQENANKKDALAAFSQLMQQVPAMSEEEVEVLRQDYLAALEKELVLAQQQSVTSAMEQYRSLSKFGFQVLPVKSMDYYLSWQTLLGLLFSAILISFGAPFWFNILKSVVGLKDAMALKHEVKKG